MTDEQRELIHSMLESIIRAEEDPSIEGLTKSVQIGRILVEDILEETKGMTLTPPPKPAKVPDTWEIMGYSTDISKEMALLEKWAEHQREQENNRVRDILEAAGLMRTKSQTEFCHERCKVLCSKPEWCPFADNPFTPGKKNDILGGRSI